MRRIFISVLLTAALLFAAAGLPAGAGDRAQQSSSAAAPGKRQDAAQQPAPHMDPPPLLNNHGERGAFVLPLETQGQGGEALKYDDFSYAAASWTLTSHEARPGHELQFDAMVAQGVSLARAMFAFMEGVLTQARINDDYEIMKNLGKSAFRFLGLGEVKAA